MRDRLENPWRGEVLSGLTPLPLAEPDGVARLLALCPVHAETPLLDLPDLARRAGVARVSVKDERERMGLGSFKALGAAHAIARAAADAVEGEDWAQALAGRVFVTASAGNHGLSVAAGARVFGAKAVILLSETVPDSFAARLAGMGAQPIREGATYEQSMAAAEKAAAERGWTLLSDSSWPGYAEWPLRVMEGYLQLAAEAARQIAEPPTHVLLQAGVGGMAAAIAAHVRATWGDAPRIVVVEPAAAPALIESIRAGRIVTTSGPVSAMGRLDCKTPSMIALGGLARDADLFVTLGEDEVDAAVADLVAIGIETSPSGGAGMAALLCGLDLGPEARVLAIMSEGAVDG
jgi:diaminopropionate ammonia-lyase